MTKPLKDYYHDLQPLDVQDVQRRVIALKQSLDFFESVIDLLPEGKAIKLTYETLYFVPPAQRNAQVAALWSFLGVAPLESEQVQYYLQPEAVKLNSAETYAWLPN